MKQDERQESIYGAESFQTKDSSFRETFSFASERNAVTTESYRPNIEEAFSPAAPAPSPVSSTSPVSSSVPSASAPQSTSESKKATANIQKVLLGITAFVGTAGVVVSAVVTALVYNILLFAAGATFLTFELDLNYEKLTSPVAVLETEGTAYSLALDGEKYITFEGLSPDTEYHLSLINGDGEVFYEGNYKTASVSYTGAIRVVTFSENDLCLQAEVSGEKLSFYTLRVTDEKGAEIFVSDCALAGPVLFAISNYPFDRTCYATITISGKGVTSLSLPADLFEPATVTVSSMSVNQSALFLSFTLSQTEVSPFLTVNGEPTPLLYEDGAYILNLSGLTPNTLYLVALTDAYGRTIFSREYRTEPLPAPATVTESDASLSYDALSVTLLSDKEGTFSLTVNGESKELSALSDSAYAITLTGLTPETDYAVKLTDEYGREVFTKTYRTDAAPAAVPDPIEVKEEDASASYDALSITLFASEDSELSLTVNGESEEPIKGSEGRYVIALTDLTPETAYVVRLTDEYEREVYMKTYYTTSAPITEPDMATVSEISSSISFDSISLLLLSDLPEEDFSLTVNGEPMDFSSAEGGKYAIELTDLAPQTLYTVTLTDEYDRTVFSKDYYTESASGDPLEPEIPTITRGSSSVTSDSISLSLESSVPDAVLYLTVNGDNADFASVSDGNYLIRLTDLDPDTSYLIELTDEYDRTVFSETYRTESASSQSAETIDLLTSSVNHDSAYVSFSMPENAAGTLTAYLDNASCELTPDSLGRSCYALFKNLEPDSFYELSVRDASGESVLYSAGITTLEEPDFVVICEDYDIGQTTFSTFFVAPDAENYDFFVFVNETMTTLSATADGYDVSAEDLDHETFYLLRIFAQPKDDPTGANATSGSANDDPILIYQDVFYTLPIG